MDWQTTANAVETSMSPTLLIVAGPNGAGKTTFAQKFLPYYADCKNFINADLIAAGISPLSPDLVAVKAGRMMLQEIKRLSTQDLDFGFETTFAGTSYVRTIRALRARGMQCISSFCGCPLSDWHCPELRNGYRVVVTTFPTRPWSGAIRDRYKTF